MIVHSSHAVLQTAALCSGHSRDVDGSLCVARGGRYHELAMHANASVHASAPADLLSGQSLQFKVQESGVRFFGRGWADIGR